MSVAKCETGWGESLSTRELLEWRDRHPTPARIRFAPCEPTLPLQGRVKKRPAEIGNVATSAPITGPERSVITEADTTNAAVMAMRSAAESTTR